MTGLTYSIHGDFAIADTTCSSGQTLSEQISCYIDVTFTPTQIGSRPGSLIVNSPNLSSALNVALSGAGENFQFVVSGLSSAVIVSGQTATYSIKVVPIDGSAGTLSMGCAGVPQNATCTVNPATLPIPDGATGTVTVTVATGVASTGSSAVMPFKHWRRDGIALAALLPCALFGLRKRRMRMSVWSAVLIAISLGCALFIPVACSANASGGGAPSTPTSSSQGPATPSNVYTLNITANISGQQEGWSVPVTLTVQ